MFTLSSLVLSAALYPIELQRLVDTKEFRSFGNGLQVVVREVELKQGVEGPFYTGYNSKSDTCVVYYNTNSEGRQTLKHMLQHADTPDLRKAWLYSVLAHEVGHCLHDHFSLIDKKRLGLNYSESVRRIEAEADAFGLYQAKQVFSAPVYASLYEQYMTMRSLETEHTHSTHSFLKLIPRIKPEAKQSD